MSKLILLVVAAVVIYVVWTGVVGKRRRHRQSSGVESMVPCARCGLNLPRSEALVDLSLIHI